MNRETCMVIYFLLLTVVTAVLTFLNLVAK